MASKDDITADLARQLLDYDPQTGVLTWKVRTPEMFGNEGRQSARARCLRWNKIYAGTKAGSLRNGYLRVRIGGLRPQAHCVIWLMLNGSWPADQLDHEDGARARNIPSNLREATGAQNAQNRRRRKTNTSGYTGVYWHKKTSKWRAEIAIRGRRIFLGLFDEKVQARNAYLAAKKQHHLFQPIPRAGA